MWSKGEGSIQQGGWILRLKSLNLLKIQGECVFFIPTSEKGKDLRPQYAAGTCLKIRWPWKLGRQSSIAAFALGAAACFFVPGASLGDQVRPEPLRIKFTASDRRDHIMSLLVLRGVQSPLLERLRKREDRAAQGAVIRLIAPEPAATDPRIDLLLSLIGSAEAGRAGYNAIHNRARVLPDKLPTEMTVQEIIDWIDATPRQNHAIGRYQIIPMTLSYLIAAEDIPLTAVFSPALQDRLALRLIEDAGLPEFLSGQMAPADFLDSLAFVWAGLPLRSGLSAYEGFAGNSATLSRSSYENRFSEIFGLSPVPVQLSAQPVEGQ
jgi:muramidase (phage lysozyme)